MRTTLVVSFALASLAEVRRVAGLERRLREGERAGFGRFLHPGNLKRLQEAVEAYLA